MRVLVACEFSGIVRDAFARRGHTAISCDIERENELTGRQFHHLGDVREIIHDAAGWDLMIAHPPYTFLTVAANRWNKDNPERLAKQEEALAFFRFLWEAPIEKICIENPIGVASTRIAKPTQIIQPYQFGHDASKKTCLWLKNLTPLRPTQYINPRVVDGKPRWANQTDSGQNRLGPSEHRAADRSRTYSGIAEAMATQWG